MADYFLPTTLRIPGLNPSQHYKVKVLENSSTNIYLKTQPPWVAESPPLSATLLEQVGLMMPVLQPESALLIHITQA